MALNLNDLQIFVHVVDHGGFSAASRALGVPKQTLSKRVAELERTAGVRLIQRTSHSFTVTELGHDLYRHAAAMVMEAEAAENVIQGRLSEPSGTVRITASIPTAQLSLAPLLPRIATSYPKIRIVLHASDRFVDVVQEGYDIVLRDHFSSLPDSELVQRRIRTQEFWLVATKQFLAGKRIPSEPTEIEGLDGLFVAPGETAWMLQDGDGVSRTVNLRPRYYANESMGLLEAAIAGLGIACLPASMCESAVRSKALIRVLPNWSAGSVTTTLLMPHRRGQLPSVRIVADLIVAQLKGD